MRIVAMAWGLKEARRAISDLVPQITLHSSLVIAGLMKQPDHTDIGNWSSEVANWLTRCQSHTDLTKGRKMSLQTIHRLLLQGFSLGQARKWAAWVEKKLGQKADPRLLLMAMEMVLVEYSKLIYAEDPIDREVVQGTIQKVCDTLSPR